MTAKSLDSQNVWEGGGGNRRHQYKLRYPAKNITPINLFSYFDVWSAVINSMIFILI